MKMVDKINKYACDHDKEILIWILRKYKWQSEFNFLVNIACVTDSPFSDKWLISPKQEGIILYKNRHLLIEGKNE